MIEEPHFPENVHVHMYVDMEFLPYNVNKLKSTQLTQVRPIGAGHVDKKCDN
jgi:hypothetical protein